MPRRGISVSVTMHVNSGCPHLNPASLPNPIYGVADAGVATQHGVVTIRTATALPEKEGVEIDSNRMVVYGRQALPPWTDNQSPTCLCNADGDHYILTFQCPSQCGGCLRPDREFHFTS